MRLQSPMIMFPQRSNENNSRRSKIRTTWLPLRRERATLSLGRKYCLPPVCAQTRTSTKDIAIGGAIQPLAEPHPLKAKRWNAAVTLSLPGHGSLNASAYDDDFGEGTFTWQKRSSRVFRRRSPTKSSSGERTAILRKPPDLEALRNLGLVAGRNRNFSLKDCLKGLILANPGKPLSRMLQKRKSNTIMRYDRRARFDMRRNSKQSTIMFSLDDSEYGHAKMSFVPKKKVAASVRLIQRASNKGLTPPDSSQDKQAGTKSSKSPSIRSDIEYDWKKNSYVLLHRIETPRRTAQLRIATNPLRVTPRMKMSLGAKASSGPSLSWTREPKTRVGEFEFGWKGIQISTDWVHPGLSICRKTSDGGYSSVSLNNKRVMKFDQNLVSKPLCGGVVLSLSSCMTNQKDVAGASLTATAPWGSISAHARTSMACGFSVTSEFARKKGSVRLKMAMENLKTASFRVGIFY